MVILVCASNRTQWKRSERKEVAKRSGEGEKEKHERNKKIIDRVKVHEIYTQILIYSNWKQNSRVNE